MKNRFFSRYLLAGLLPITALHAAAAATAVAAKAAPLQVQSLTHRTGRDTQRFPFVVAGDAADAAVAGRINQRLFIETFERMAPVRAGDGLREVGADGWKSLSSVAFRVLRNDARVLSLAVDGESCGAYCEDFVAPHAFDAATGRHLEVDDLVTPAGRQALAAAVQAANTAALRKRIAELKKASAAPRQKAADRDEMEDRTALFETCLTERATPAWRRIQDVGQMTLEAAAGLTFVQGRCSNHAMRALDDLGDFRNRFDLMRLKPWLTPYGLALLAEGGTDRGSAATPAVSPALSPFGQVLRGTLDGRQPVTLWLRAPERDGSTGGLYFYDRHRSPIELSGTVRDDGTVALVESVSSAKIELKPQGAGLRGSWQEGNRRLPFVVAP